MELYWNVDWLFQSFLRQSFGLQVFILSLLYFYSISIIIFLFNLYNRFHFYLFQCFGSSLGLLVCKITPLGFCSTLLPTLFTPSGKYLFVSTQQIHWSCLVILLKFFLYLWLTSFLSAGGLLSQYSSSCCRKTWFQFTWNENIYGKK